MNPVVYGGYCHFPDHPQSDLHGIVRFCVKTSSPYRVREALLKYGVDLNPRELNRTWGPTKSIIESDAASQRYGEVYFCNVSQAYQSLTVYRLDRSLTLTIRKENERLAKAEGHKVASAPRRGEKRIEFP